MTINGISEKVQQIKFDVEIRIMKVVTALSQEVSGKVRQYFDFQDLVMEPNDIIYESSHDFEIFVTKAIHAKAGELTGGNQDESISFLLADLITYFEEVVDKTITKIDSHYNIQTDAIMFMF